MAASARARVHCWCRCMATCSNGPSVAGAGENRSRPGAVSAAREVAEAGCSVILGMFLKEVLISDR